MDYDDHILYHLKSLPCNEMMAFYFKFFKFDSWSVIILLNEPLLKVSIKPQHILYQTSRYPHKNCPCLSIKWIIYFATTLLLSIIVTSSTDMEMNLMAFKPLSFYPSQCCTKTYLSPTQMNNSLIFWHY
jgi:hypothetical protein